MTDSADVRTEVELARAFTRAYKEMDREAMRGLLKSDARVRVLMPRGFFEYAGSDGLIDVLTEFGGKWRFDRVEELSVEVLAQNLMKTGRLVSSNHRFHLRSAGGDRTATMVIHHLLAVADGRIALVDELCTGVMPDAP